MPRRAPVPDPDSTIYDDMTLLHLFRFMFFCGRIRRNCIYGQPSTYHHPPFSFLFYFRRGVTRKQPLVRSFCVQGGAAWPTLSLVPGPCCPSVVCPASIVGREGGVDRRKQKKDGYREAEGSRGREPRAPRGPGAACRMDGIVPRVEAGDSDGAARPGGRGGSGGLIFVVLSFPAPWGISFFLSTTQHIF